MQLTKNISALQDVWSASETHQKKTNAQAGD